MTRDELVVAVTQHEDPGTGDPLCYSMADGYLRALLAVAQRETMFTTVRYVTVQGTAGVLVGSPEEIEGKGEERWAIILPADAPIPEGER